MAQESDEFAGPAGGVVSQGPIGKGDYEVQAGDCMDSIAFEHGFFWQTLWNLDENADLKRRRKDPNVLLAGDRLTIPKIRLVDVECTTEKRHRFTLRGVPAKLRIGFFEDGEPRAREKYVLKIEGEMRRGELDDDGFLEEPIPPNAKVAFLRFEDEDTETALRLGMVDPVTEIEGVKERLRNLGFDPGPIDRNVTLQTQQAIRLFQQQNALQSDGVPDRQTRDKLVEIHGS